MWVFSDTSPVLVSKYQHGCARGMVSELTEEEALAPRYHRDWEPLLGLRPWVRIDRDL